MQNAIVSAVNRNNKIPKFVVMVLDDDLIQVLKFKH